MPRLDPGLSVSTLLAFKENLQDTVCARVFFKAFVDHQIYIYIYIIIYIYSFAVFPSNSGQVSNARRVSDGTRAGRPAHERPTCGQLSTQPNNLDDFGVPNSLSKPQVQLKIFQVGTFHRIYVYI